MQVGDILYRANVYVDHYYPNGRQVSISFEERVVHALTPKGMWLCYQGDSIEKRPHYRQWVSFRTRKFSATKEEALLHLTARKASHVKHARRRMRDAEAALEAANEAHLNNNLPDTRLRTLDAFGSRMAAKT